MKVLSLEDSCMSKDPAWRESTLKNVIAVQHVKQRFDYVGGKEISNRRVREQRRNGWPGLKLLAYMTEVLLLH